jgi:hypothetical protein
MHEMVGDVLAMIEDQMARPVVRSCGQRRQLFLYLKERQKTMIRPLINLDVASAFAIHNRYHPDMKRKIYVVCAREINKPCYYCRENSRGEQVCDAELSFMLPVFVYSLIDTRSGRQIMYRDQDGQDRPVSGVRLLELTAFGAVRDILATFSAFVQAGGDISDCDWTLEQFVSSQGKRIVAKPRPLKSLTPQLKAQVPSEDLIRKCILEFAPPIPSLEKADIGSKISTSILHSSSYKGLMPAVDWDDDM